MLFTGTDRELSFTSGSLSYSAKDALHLSVRANPVDTLGDTSRTSFWAEVHKLPAPLRYELAEAESTTERRHIPLDVVPEE